MADMQSPQHPMEILPAMLNLVLLQTSKILREPECHNMRHTGPPKRRITEIVTTANQRFHDALDEVEIEILQAKAVMERDLRAIRQKRADRDRANGPSPAPSPSKVVDGTANEAGGISAETNSTIVINELPESPKFEDSQMTDFDFRLQAPIAQMQELPLKSDDADGLGAVASMSQDVEDHSSLAIAIPAEVTSKTQNQPESIDNKTTSMIDAGPEPSLDAADPADFDFESMFNDNDLINADDTTSFGLDFSTDNATQNIMNNDTFENIDISDADMANEDINSLLPGLENYVNADTHLSSLGMPATSSQLQPPQPIQRPAAVTSGAPAPNVEGTAPLDSNIDHLFDGIDFDSPSNGVEEMGDTSQLDLDDFNWD
ncbi:hypothetical protein P7C71_g6290, partial [Lecanoromycetidae sp. Uapishka_2]